MSGMGTGPHRWGVALAVCAVACMPRAAPGQAVDTVRVGSASLAAARIPATQDTVDSYKVEGGTRTPVSTTVRTITRSESPEPLVLIHSLHWTPGGDTSVTTIAARQADLSLVYHRVKASHDSAAVTATRTHLTGWVVLPNRPTLLLDRTLERPVFPVEGQVPWLFPALPLARGYRAAIPHFSQWEGREMWTTIEVLAEEPVQVGRNIYACWKVDAGPLGPPGYRVIRWVDRDSRRVVQSVLRGESGGPEYWSYIRL